MRRSLLQRKVVFLMIKMQQKAIEHSADRQNYIEKSTLVADILDDDIFLQQLGFHNPLAFKKVDYIKTREQTVFLIELTDLTDEIKNCLENQWLLNSKPKELLAILKQSDLDIKTLGKKLWFEVIEEFKGKFVGSMVCYVRLLRLNGDNSKVDYHLMVALKNNTDPRYFDFLQTNLTAKLKNITGDISILRTQDLTE